jgi:hypothetical protein
LERRLTVSRHSPYLRIPGIPSAPTTSGPDINTREKELEERLNALEARLQEYEQIAPQADQLALLLDQGEQTANLLNITEVETRHRLIDRDLARAGWKVGYKGANTSEVGQEHVLNNDDRADYVLWDDNRRLFALVIPRYVR